MKKSERAKLKWIFKLSPIVGVLIGLGYLWLKSEYNWTFAFTNPQAVATIISGFSFTMMGFLAAIAAFFFSLQRYRFFKRWVEDGNLEVFLCLFKVSIVCLFATFSLSLVVFSKLATDLAFQLMMMSVINNVLQLVLVTFISFNNAGKANLEDD